MWIALIALHAWQGSPFLTVACWLAGQWLLRKVVMDPPARWAVPEPDFSWSSLSLIGLFVLAYWGGSQLLLTTPELRENWGGLRLTLGSVLAAAAAVLALWLFRRARADIQLWRYADIRPGRGTLRASSRPSA